MHRTIPYRIFDTVHGSRVSVPYQIPNPPLVMDKLLCNLASQTAQKQFPALKAFKGLPIPTLTFANDCIIFTSPTRTSI